MLLVLEAKTMEINAGRVHSSADDGPGGWERADAAANTCFEVLGMCSTIKSPMQDALLATVPVLNRLLFLPSTKAAGGRPEQTKAPVYAKYLDASHTPLVPALGAKAQPRRTYYRSYHSNPFESRHVGCQTDAENSVELLSQVSTANDTVSQNDPGEVTVPLQVHQKLQLELLQLKRELLTAQREHQNIPALKKARDDLEHQRHNAQFYIPGQSASALSSATGLLQPTGSTMSSQTGNKLDPESMTMMDWDDRKAKRQALLLENLALQEELRLAKEEIGIMESKIRYLRS